LSVIGYRLPGAAREEAKNEGVTPLGGRPTTVNQAPRNGLAAF
jgi:hypothetical protein